MGRSGPVYRRCTGCRQRMASTRCPCGHGRFTWTFTVEVAPSGATTRQQVKRGGFARKQDALDAMQAELVDRRRGGHVPTTKLSFGDYATAWLEERARTRVDLGQLAETTFAICERDLRNHLVPALEAIPLQQLDGGTLTRHYAQLLERLSTKSIANVHGLAHRILHDAVRDGLLPHNPADRAVKPKAPETEQPTWTPEEVATFLAYVRQDDADWHALFATMAVTGIRRGEAVGAMWAATDLGAGTLEIRQTITKAGSKVVVKSPKSRRSRRVVALPATLVTILAEHRDRQDERRVILGSDWLDLDLVFPNEVGRYRYPDYVSTRFATYARRAGLPHIGGPHGLRHSLASALDASGSGLATISALLGHASTAVTSKVYTHMLKGADRAAVDSHAATLLGEARRGSTGTAVPPSPAEAAPADKRPEVADPGMAEDPGVA
jgi:integrase